MEIPFNLFTGRLRGGDAEVVDVDGRIITSSRIKDIGWGPDSEDAQRVALAESLLFHAGIRDTGTLAAWASWDVVALFPSDGWTITTDQLAHWANNVRRGENDGTQRRR